MYFVFNFFLNFRRFFSFCFLFSVPILYRLQDSIQRRSLLVLLDVSLLICLFFSFLYFWSRERIDLYTAWKSVLEQSGQCCRQHRKLGPVCINQNQKCGLCVGSGSEPLLSGTATTSGTQDQRFGTASVHHGLCQGRQRKTAHWRDSFGQPCHQHGPHTRHGYARPRGVVEQQLPAHHSTHLWRYQVRPLTPLRCTLRSFMSSSQRLEVGYL